MDDDSQMLEHSNELMYSFWNLHKNVMHYFKTTVANNGLSVPMFVVLITISRNGGEMIQKDVQMKTHFPKSTLSQAVDSLVNAGLLRRQQQEGNRREMHLAISQKGKNLIQQLHTQENSIYQRFRHAEESLSDQQLQELLMMLKQVSSYFSIEGGSSK